MEIEKITLKRGRPKKVKIEKEKRPSGRPKIETNNYKVTYKGIENEYKTITEISETYGISITIIHRIINNKVILENLTIEKLKN